MLINPGDNNLESLNRAKGANTGKKAQQVKIQKPKKANFLRADRVTETEKEILSKFAASVGQEQAFEKADIAFSEKYGKDSTPEANFARVEVAEEAIKRATTYTKFKYLCFPGILNTWSVYSILFLHREDVVTTKPNKFDKFFFFYERLQMFDQILRNEFRKLFGATLYENRKAILRNQYKTEDVSFIETLAKQYVEEKLTYLPFDAFSYCALKGVFCKRRDIFVKLKDYTPIGFRSSLILDVFYFCFGDVMTFRHVCRLLNVYIHHYGMEKKIDGFLIDDNFVKYRVSTKYQSRLFRTSLVDFCLNNPLADEDAKEIVRDRKTVLNKPKRKKTV